MIILGTELSEATAPGINLTDHALSVDLMDGRTITAPLAWFPRLAYGTPVERANWRLIGNGEGIHWADLDRTSALRVCLPGEGPDKARVL